MTGNTKNKKISVCAVIVTYHPNKGMLSIILNKLSNQVQKIIIVDNSEYSPQWLIDVIKTKNIHCLELGSNKGIAAAQNIGIVWARENGYSHVLLMDQDSFPEKKMIYHLTQAMILLEKVGKKVAVVGPMVNHSRTGRSELFLIRKRNIVKRVQFKKGDGVVKVENIISSGSLIPLWIFDIVGYLDESLFIDFVDTEWCFRAQSKGYKSYLVCRASLDHHLGKTEKLDYSSYSRIVVRHSPERYYYQYRNAILLLKKKYIPRCWKIYQIIRQMIPRFIVQALILSPRKENATQMVVGLWHGLLNITGPKIINR